jgi:hypothetical protein|tara:strand:- start:1122 stop:1346 length:225 start_codon:yes stop_codon:yes gene_type:complete
LSDLKLKGRIVRDSTNEIQIYSGEYWKKEVVDFRWYQNDKPTKKGIRMNLEEARRVHTILTRILNEADIDVEMD